MQGVGFRPFVYRLAREYDLGGFVRNDAVGVWIEVEGAPPRLAEFESRLRSAPPPLARIRSVEVGDLPAIGSRDFSIASSVAASGARTMVPEDRAPCADCSAELFDPSNRRYRYPFINCTACGPRYTIARAVPYDRARTTMSAFTLCAECRAEYEDPRSRRFHAEPTACARCGPALRLIDSAGTPRAGEPLDGAVAELFRGAIVAVRGVGGYLLAVNARDEAAVARLRVRKHRPAKPFAVMARDLAEVERIARMTELERETLLGGARPIMLLPSHEALAGVAPRLCEIGVMLPSSPLHALLLAAGPPLQVMTSGNQSEEPIAMDDEDALARLGDIADVFLTHDRAIHTRSDDSVVRVVAGKMQPVRRARGLVPSAITLPFEGPPLVGVGADLKNAVCVTRGGEAFLSQHIGDLASPVAFAFFTETIAKLGHLLDVRPELAAHDLHPDYRSTWWALGSGLACAPVQHHHAHVAACLAEHGRSERAIGVAFDGTGCGPAGDLWGGEILTFDLAGFDRAGHLRPLALVGGEAAIREPWRLALAALIDAEAPRTALAEIDPQKQAIVARMIARNVASPRATGAGRWFDAVAAICGVARVISYEGQAAIELEALASAGDVAPYPFAIEGVRPFVVDLRPTIRGVAGDVAAGVSVAQISARFHETLAQAIARSCCLVRESAGLTVVALSGGCFQNRRLTERALALLGQGGFEVLIHRRVPPNDGGIALGQAAIASCRSWQRRTKG